MALRDLLIEANEKVWYNEHDLHLHYNVNTGRNRKGIASLVQAASLTGASHLPFPKAPTAQGGLRVLDLLQGGAGARVLRQGSAQGVQENLPRERPVAGLNNPASSLRFIIQETILRVFSAIQKIVIDSTK